MFCHRSKAHIAVVLHAGLLAIALPVGRNDDDSIGSSAAINGRSRSIFENIHADNLRGLHRVEVHSGDAIHHNQWAIAGRKRCSATQTQARSGLRSTATLHNREPCYLALQQLFGARNDTFSHVFCVDRRNSSCEIALAHRAISHANDGCFGQGLGVFHQRNVHVFSGFHTLCDITHVGDVEQSACRTHHFKVPIHISYAASGAINHFHIGPNQGLLLGI